MKRRPFRVFRKAKSGFSAEGRIGAGGAEKELWEAKSVPEAPKKEPWEAKTGGKERGRKKREDRDNSSLYNGFVFTF